MKKTKAVKIGRGPRPSPVWLSGELFYNYFNYFQIDLPFYADALWARHVTVPQEGYVRTQRESSWEANWTRIRSFHKYPDIFGAIFKSLRYILKHS